MSMENTKSAVPMIHGWGARHTISLMGFFGFLLAYVMRYNLSLAIVSMVDQQHVLFINLKSKSGNSSSLISEEHEVCPHHYKILGLNQSTDFDTSRMISYEKDFNSTLISDEEINIEEDNQFHWTEQEQGLILGSFFIGYVITQYPGGKLAEQNGAKWVFSLGILLTGILSMALPWVTFSFGKNGLIAIRVLQGLSEGVLFPAIGCMIAHWSVPEERSRMSNLIFAGIPLGTAITMISGGYFIQIWGWPAIFYASGICSFIWFIFWCFFVFDYPSTHPRISAAELQFIEYAMNGQTNKEYIPTPWKKVVTSIPVLAILIVHVGHQWGHILLHAEVPKYLHSVHDFDIAHNGWLSALPQILNFIVCIIISHFSDFLIVKKYTSILFTRKMCSTIALWGSAAAFLGIIFGGCNTLVAVTCLNLAGAALGGSNGAWIVNNIDIAPNHAGSIMGVANTFANLFAFVVPYGTGMILQANPSLTGWKLVFLIPAILNFTINIAYLIFAKAEEQPWNRPKSVAPAI